VTFAMKAFRVSLLVFASLLIIAAGIILLVQIVSFIDPESAQASNDHDPNGTPPSRLESLAEMLATCAVALFGFWLLRRTAIILYENRKYQPPSNSALHRT
jgi:hypothetical protein